MTALFFLSLDAKELPKSPCTPVAPNLREGSYAMLAKVRLVSRSTEKYPIERKTLLVQQSSIFFNIQYNQVYELKLSWLNLYAILYFTRTLLYILYTTYVYKFFLLFFFIITTHHHLLLFLSSFFIILYIISFIIKIKRRRRRTKTQHRRQKER